MKALSQPEIETLVQELQQYQGWYLQDNLGNSDQLGLGLYKNQKRWIWLHMRAAAPVMVVLTELPPGFKKAPKPIHLFLNTHGRGLQLVQVKVKSQLGRVVEFKFASDEKMLRLEVSLIPHHQNVLVEAGGKTVSWFKPKPSPPAQEFVGVAGRTSEEILAEYLHKPTAEKKKPELTAVTQGKKIEQIRSRLQEQLQQIDSEKWLRLGEKLKTPEPLTADEQKFFKGSPSRSEMMEQCFAKAKQLVQKREAILLRLQQLELPAEPRTAPAVLTPRKVEQSLHYRTFRSQGGYEIHIGKSGPENLRLLRNAQPWFYWLHVRDYPGSFGILPRNKNQSIPHKEMVELAAHLVRQSLPAKQRDSALGRFEVLVSECRFVKPMKGAKPGMVTYTDEKVIRVDL